MALGTSLPFGMRQVKLTQYTDASATALSATSYQLPNSQLFSFTESEDFEDLRGDDRLQTSHGKGPEIDWEITGGGVSLDVYAILAGGTPPTTVGTTPNQVKVYNKLVTDQRLPFKAEGRAISDSGGDFHSIVWRCKTTGDISGSFEDGKFMLTNAKGKGYAQLLSGVTVGGVSVPVDTVYTFVQNETATVIT